MRDAAASSIAASRSDFSEMVVTLLIRSDPTAWTCS